MSAPKEITERPQDVATPKTIVRGVYVRDLILSALVAGALGLVGGWFLHINTVSDAKQAVVADMQLTSKTQAK